MEWQSCRETLLTLDFPSLPLPPSSPIRFPHKPPPTSLVVPLGRPSTPSRTCPPFRNRFPISTTQSGRRPGPDKPYASDARNGRNGPSSNRGGPSGLSPLASRIAKPKPTNINPRRLPEGTPPILRVNEVDRKEAKRSEHKLSEKLGSEEMKQWLRSRLIAEGVLNFSVSKAGTPFWHLSLII